MKNKKTTIAFCFLMGTGAISNALADQIPSCTTIDSSNYLSVIENKNIKKMINPFNKDECLPVSFKSKDPGGLSVADFDGKSDVFDIYKEFLEKPHMSVEVVRDKADGKVYKFLKFDTDTVMTDRLKKYFKRLDIVHAHSEEFLFLHELMHLDAVTQSKNVSRQEKEAASDISAVFMISSKHNYSLEQTKSLLSDIYEFRKKAATSGFRSTFGGNIKDELHFNKDTKNAFKRAFAYIDELQNSHKNLKIKNFIEARDLGHKITFET